MEYDRRRGRVVLRFETPLNTTKPIASEALNIPDRDDLEPIPQIQN